MPAREPAPFRVASISFGALILMGAVGLYFGWRLFWFLTDDAFIEFRYASNSVAELGYVWNAAPFLPVEGYTSFLWVALLDVVWRVTGLDPTQTANAISLVFSFGSLLLAAIMIVRIRWSARLRRAVPSFLALTLLGILTNRTFLTWTSSGLEAAMFGFFATAWVYCAVVISAPRKRAVMMSSTAALIALTRPDGLLFAAASVVGALIAARSQAKPHAARTFLFGVLPLAIVVAHELWRWRFYGAWLPNTYYAKVVGAWPASGVRYAASYVLEYALWFPVVAVIGLAVKRRVRITNGDLRRHVGAHATPLLAVAVVLTQLAYYTFIVGGDHFEYRVYSYTVPLFFVALAYSLNALDVRVRTGLAVTTTFIVLAALIPWTHWSRTHALQTRQETFRMFVPVAPAWPAPVAWYADAFDRCQKWLRTHSVCVRHQEHKVFWKHQLAMHPSRAEGSAIPHDAFAVMATGAVGVPGWVFPRVSILDTMGLNDYVIARTPYPKAQVRRMAHGRQAPRGYIESYRPNATEDGVVEARERPLTANEIACLERFWRERIPEIERGAQDFDVLRACSD